MKIAKRLGRYHKNLSINNNNNGNSKSYSNELDSLYKDNCSKPLLDWNIFVHKNNSLEKVFANANKAIEKSTQFINKFKSRELACVNRAKLIPENATIRKEYIKCGKQMCELKHGPYYYAYWKDPESKKLRKKYIGDHTPKNKGELRDDINNNPTQ